MTDSYYPHHSNARLDVIEDWPMPAQDIPRLTQEIRAQREIIQQHERNLRMMRGLLADICGALEASSIPTTMEREFIELIHKALDA